MAGMEPLLNVSGRSPMAGTDHPYETLGEYFVYCMLFCLFSIILYYTWVACWTFFDLGRAESLDEFLRIAGAKAILSNNEEVAMTTFAPAAATAVTTAVITDSSSSSSDSSSTSTDSSSDDERTKGKGYAALKQQEPHVVGKITFDLPKEYMVELSSNAEPTSEATSDNSIKVLYLEPGKDQETIV